jgi:hypothetical protein
MDLESLGFTKDDVEKKLLDRLCGELLGSGVVYDDEEEGSPRQVRSAFRQKLEKAIQAQIDASIAKIIDEHIKPHVDEIVSGLTLQATNKWGEAKGERLTFIEYLVQRAEAYMTEEVNFQGKTRARESCSWSAAQTRIAWMVHQHLQYNIEVAMKKALANANSTIVVGLQEAVKIKLKEVSDSLTVSVQTK